MGKYAGSGPVEYGGFDDAKEGCPDERRLMVNEYDPRQRETADYVCDMVLELRNAARVARLQELAEVLKYAYYRAYSVSNHVPVPRAEAEHLQKLELASGDCERNRPALVIAHSRKR